MEKLYDAAIIGAGASGLMAAYETSHNGLEVVMFEKNPHGARKIYATGNGCCNFLNAEADASYYDSKASSPEEVSEFAEKVFEQVGVQDLLDAFEERGLVGMETEEGRMYPRSNQAGAVARVLRYGSRHCDIQRECEVASARKEAGVFVITAADGREFRAKQLLISGGGKAGIQFGSDGHCYKIAQSFGHHVEKPIPALAPLCCKEDITKIAGVRTKCMVSLLRTENGEDSLLAMGEYGEIQFNKDSISGICVMNLARHIVYKEGVSYKLLVDFLWDYDREEVSDMLAKRAVQFGLNRALDSVVPEKLADYILDDEPSLELAVKRCKSYAFNIITTKGWPDAQTTAGGVLLSEVDPATMESKLVPGLYFSGEILDADAPCGGFNLTWAFATGTIAGRSMCERS